MMRIWKRGAARTSNYDRGRVLRAGCVAVGLVSSLTIVPHRPAHAETFARGGVFLPLGHGARAHGLGGAAAVATLDDAAVAWNPANLTWIPRRAGLTLMHAEFLPGVEHGYDTATFGRAFGAPLGSGDEVLRPARYGYGLMLTHFGLELGTGDWSENGVVAAGAMALENFISIGAAAKFLNVANDFEDGGGCGAGLDLAATALVTDRVMAALVVRDAWTRVRWDTRTWQTQPRSFDAGLAVRVHPRWLVEVNARAGRHVQSTAAGIEWNVVRDVAWLRGGWTTVVLGEARAYPSAGAGVRHDRFGIDYAASFDVADALDFGQRVSLQVRF
jgi:hypothetical protein